MDNTELPQTVIAARPSSSSKNGLKYYKNYYQQGHLLLECPTVQCRYFHKIGHIVYNCPTRPHKPGHSRTLPRPGNPSIVAAAKESLSAPSLSSVSVSELRSLVFSIVKQILSTSGKVSSAVSGNTWYFDFACCNHMSPDSQLFSSVIPTTHAPLIQTANGSYISANHTGYDLWFGSSGCRVQDPWTNQVLGTGRRVGRMFELTSLHLPSTLTPPPSQVAHTASVFPLSLWHLRLDPSAILPISPVDSTVSPLAPPPAVDPVLDQTPDLPLAAPPADSPASPQAPAPPVDPVTDQTPLLPLRRSDRVRAPPAHLRDYSCFSAILSLHEPHTYYEACTNPLWQQAMTEELQALEKTHTWDLVDLPHVHQWPLFQMDVKNAFLNGDLTEEVYMQAPPGYSNCPDKVCLLRRALYGLKQAPRAWFAKFSSIVHQFGFSSSSHDTALFIRQSDKGMILLLLYVDDMIITGDDHSGISDFKLFLHQQFEMKDLGHLSYFLGLEVSSDSTGYYLSQAKYASDLLSRAGLTNTKVVSTPLEMNARLTPLDGTPLSDATLYRQLVGSLVYLTVTHPDIAHAVHLVSQFLYAPHSTHYAAVIHILLYIKGTMFHGLHFSAHSTLDLYSLISWRSKKQHIVSRSSIEAEYRALADTTSELLALRWLLEDMGLTHSSPTVIHCDNRSAIQIAHNDVFHERTKHIEIDCHLVRHHLSAGILRLLPVSLSDQTADIFTKTFPSGRFRDLVSKLKMASDSEGWMLVKDHSVLSGAATTRQSISYRDDFRCYSRTVKASDGKLISDNTTPACFSSV
uniref:Reverse transcriptase Ty1/copia-type domain-containing protein n=1 Tax=Fagus sylvatica TaxID=28930 RepID=A0A2N9GRW0_FAGSY